MVSLIGDAGFYPSINVKVDGNNIFSTWFTELSIEKSKDFELFSLEVRLWISRCQREHLCCYFLFPSSMWYPGKTLRHQQSPSLAFTIRWYTGTAQPYPKHLLGIPLGIPPLPTQSVRTRGSGACRRGAGTGRVRSWGRRCVNLSHIHATYSLCMCVYTVYVENDIYKYTLHK